jgi:hypothetical protein
MNTSKAATDLIAKAQSTRWNVDVKKILGAFFVENAPTIAPQRDGRMTLVRVMRGKDEKVTDLDTDAAVTMLTTWLAEIVVDLPSPKAQARYDARLAELGWA